MYKNRDITLARIAVTTGWTGFNPKGSVPPGRMSQNLCARLWTRHDRAAVSLAVVHTPAALVCATGAALRALAFREAAVGESFGPTWATHVFRLDIVVPDEMHNACLHLVWDANCEAMVMDAEGAPRQGLVGGDHHCRRVDYPLFPDRPGGCAVAGETVTLYVETSANGLFGAGRGGDIEPPDENKYYELEECCIAVFDRSAWAVIHDLTVLEGLAKDLPEGPARDQALVAANDVVNAVVVDDPETYPAARAAAAAFLSNNPNGPRAPVVHSMLNSHIDLAWLWPASVTPAKAARTFSTQLRLLEEYPEAVFVQSQAQLYDWMRTQYPTVFKEITKRVKEGRFVPCGATWVEMDTNLPSGESLIRQFVLGQRFFKEHFDLTCNNFFLPDTFGYAAQLPQIMKGCGVSYFLTNKLSWNAWNKFPHSSFMWEGLDGSEVIAHMPPSETYNAQAFPDEVVRSAFKNKDAGVLPHSIMLVGHGDGGGGASPAMLESMARMRDVESVPRVVPSTVDKFFAEAEKVKNKLPRWVGELYFELHRGTYTSQASTKLKNRQCENALKDVEMLSTYAMLMTGAKSYKAGQNGNKSFQYPAEELDRCWELVLLNCFHDTLPGSCIKAQYVITARDHASVLEKCTVLQARALEALIAVGHPSRDDGNTDSESEKQPMLKHRRVGEDMQANIPTVNGGAVESRSGCNGVSACPRDSTTRVPHVAFVSRGTGWEPTVKGKPYIASYPGHISNKSGAAVQLSAIHPGHSLLALSSAPTGLGLWMWPGAVRESDAASILPAVSVQICEKHARTEYVLANRVCRARMSSSGRLISLVLHSEHADGEDRETIAEASAETISAGYHGEGNALVVFCDVPMFWDAWDCEVYSSSGEKVELVQPAARISVEEEGPLRATLLVEYPATRGGSRIRQHISLCAESARLDFRTSVDWRESRKMLRVCHKTTVRAPHASFDTQFGHIQRPTHWNTSHDAAKFEVVGHQYADLSGYKFGVALLNDCKYGYAVRDSEMRLSLLRSPKSPDDTCDMGHHLFTYALRPHWDSFPCRSVIESAADLNWAPLGVPLPAGAAPPRGGSPGSLVRVARGGLDSVIISAVKAARGARDARRFVVRAYEGLGARGRGGLAVGGGLRVVSAAPCNMLEEVAADADGVSVDAARNTVWMTFRPFQIRTVVVLVD